MKRMKTYIGILFFLLISIFTKAQSVGGTVTANTTVCAGSNAGVLSVTGATGSVLYWESSPTISGPWTSIMVNTTFYNYTNLLQTTYFRVAVQLTGFGIAYSVPAGIICDAPSVAGVLTTPTLQCINLPVTGTLSGNTGSVIAWEYSTNLWFTTNTITTTNTLVATLASLTNTTLIRAVVKNGTCPLVYSNTVTVNPAPNSVGGTINGSQTVCATANSSILTLNSFTGAIQQWESSLSNGGPYTPVASSSGTNQLGFANLTQTTYYRTVVKNSTCPAVFSNTVSVKVDAPSIGGSIVGTQQVCAGANSGSLQLVANTGQVTQWEFSTNAGFSWSPIVNTTINQNFTNISGVRLYRATVQNGSCATTLSNQFTVSVNALPTPTFNLTNACVMALANFTNVTNGVNTYNWDFGDAGSASILSPSHTYLASGTYTVKLTATSTLSCTDSIKKIITVHPRPTPNFISAADACFGNAILFTNASSITSGSVTQIKFNFNDGSPTASVSPANHSFVSPGSYSVFITATSALGCKDSIYKLVTVHPKPNTNFVANNVCKGSAVNFNNQSVLSSGGMQQLWNMGNTYTTSLFSPNYTYPAAGIYTVSLISISNNNCKDTAYKVVVVNEKPTVTFTANNVCLGAAVNFTMGFNPITPTVVTTVNFGDGQFSTLANPSHIYLVPGTFATSVTAVTDSGCVSTKQINVTVFPKPLANFNFNNVCNADSILFNNTSSIAGGAVTYSWNFSGIGTSTVNSPKFLYTTPGSYTVSLKAISNFGCRDSVIKPITIFDAPNANFNFSNSCDGSPVTFTNISTVNSGAITINNWNFGDNTSVSLVNPTKTYLNNGSYTVTLICSSSNGCTDTVRKTVNVFEGPLANFTATNQCKNIAVPFTNISTLNVGTYTSLWKFGDNATSTINSPSHLYTAAGSYMVVLKITSNNGCVDSVKRFVDTYSIPLINAGKDSTINKGFGLQLNATGAQNYSWYPTTGLNNPVIANPIANPDTDVTYIVEGVDANGCRNTDTLRIKVSEEFLVVPYNVVTPDANGKNDTWIVKNIQAYPNNKVIIFDQWNQKVYEKEGYANEWEGKNKTGEILPDATYYYLLTFKGTSKNYNGFITLMRNRK
jgi:gliding motility-associated-like protein